MKDSEWRARAALDTNTLPAGFVDSSTATIEAVVSIIDASVRNRILFFGHEDAGDTDRDDLAFRTGGLGHFEIRVRDDLSGHWTYNQSNSRIVTHAVISLKPGNATAERRVFINGYDVGDGDSYPPAETSLDLSISTDLVLGNGREEASSFAGTIYYAAVYSRVLAPEEIQTNAALLLLNDDGPTPANPIP